MLVKLAYGKTGLEVNFPEERTTVIEPVYVPGLPDEKGALVTAIRNPLDTRPLRQMVRPDQTVAISVCDITRPMPSSTVLPVLLDELRHIPKKNIVIMIATGTHRANSEDELRQMFGHEIVENFEVVNHDAFDNSGLAEVGQTPNGVPIFLNRRWVDSDFKITTGFVEPHFFAGFSGGPKMVAPGLAGFETIMRLHNAAMIGDANSRWGVTEGNPIHDEVRQIARQTGTDFSLDVTINRAHKITSVYAGEMFAVHRAACGNARRWAMQAVEQPFDIVVTTNSGYPLDQNLYQAVKGMSAAAQIVRKGGTIICAAECLDGVPEHGQYKQILSEAGGPEELLEKICSPGYDRHDQWQVQIQAQIQLRSNVLLKSSHLTDQQVRSAHIEPIVDIEECLRDLLGEYGEGARVCVLPEGPQTIPYIKSRD